MCRWLAYSGSPIALETLLLEPEHSLIDQSLHARMGVRSSISGSISGELLKVIPPMRRSSEMAGLTHAKRRLTARTELFVLNRAYLWSMIGLVCFILFVGEALGQQELWDKHMQVAKEAYAKSNYLDAEQHVLAAIEAAEMFPSENPRAGSSIDFLAHVYKAMGRFKDAESRFEEALEFYALRVGPAHPWTIAEINNLGGLYFELGRYSDAAPLFRIAAGV